MTAFNLRCADLMDTANHCLSVYLNDHMAGAVAAVEVLAELRRVDGFTQWADQLSAEIESDRRELEQLMSEAKIAQSRSRRAAAYVSEKLAEIKLRLEDRRGGALQRLELLETLSLGIEGKRSLWTSLRAAADNDPVLQKLDFARLILRAEEQRRSVEPRRLQAAAEALHPVTV